MGKGIKENRVHSNSISVGVPGFEPGMTGPESVVLPLHHTPIKVITNTLCERRCKYTAFITIAK